MNDSQLDDLLNAPLAAVADGGFSARVIARARMERLKEKAPILGVGFICGGALLFYVPLPQITTAFAHVLAGGAVLPAISLAAAAMVLTFTVERALAQR